MWPRESGLRGAACLLQLVGRWADGKWIARANGHLLRRWRSILAGVVPGIAETCGRRSGTVIPAISLLSCLWLFGRSTHLFFREMKLG